MKVSGRKVADAISKKLAAKIQKKNLKPKLAIILAGNYPPSKIYIQNKIKAAKEIGVETALYEFKNNELKNVFETIDKLNNDSSVNGIIIQHPVFDNWDFDEIISKVNPQKDVDGFREDSPYDGATALGVWEMLTAFSLIEGYKKTARFLKDKKIVLVGKGKAAGGPTFKLLEKKGFTPDVVVKETENPTPIIRNGDVIISATGAKNVINKNNLKPEVYVIGVGVGREKVDGKEKIYGDIKEDEVSKLAKLYCPTIGGIGPLTIVSLLKNVVKSAERN